MPTPDPCSEETSLGATDSFTVELQVNGTAIEGRTYKRTHAKGISDAVSIAGSVGCFLKKDDIVTIVVKPTVPDGRTYSVPNGMASMTVVRSRIHG